MLPFNIMPITSKVFITPDMITNMHFYFFVFEFKLNFTHKYFMNNIINQAIESMSFQIKTE